MMRKDSILQLDFNIITYHDGVNYGGILQAFALKTFINRLGYSSGVYDYRIWNPDNKTGIKNKIRKLLERADNKEQKRKRDRTNRFTEEFLNLNLEDDPRVFVTGSDTVWNSGASLNPMFFLRFTEKSVIRASYAASMGMAKIEEANRERIFRYINDLDFVSVREPQVKKLLCGNISKDIAVHLDPVFMLNREEWEQIAQPISDLPEKYILVYLLRLPQNINNFLKWLQKKAKEPIVLVEGDGGVQGRVTDLIKHDYIVRDAGPREFVWLMLHADKVVTSAFHGTVFSILFNKEFYTIIDPLVSSRMVDILNFFNLKGYKEQDIKSGKYTRNNIVDWDSVNDILIQERKRSELYLREVYEFSKQHTQGKDYTKLTNSNSIVRVKDICTGCSACAEVCSLGAIDYKLNALGFYQPFVDDKKCIQCGKCLEICPVEHFNGRTRKRAYYGWNTDSKALFNSTSGGAFLALAKCCIDAGGVVYSAVYSHDFRNVIFKSSDEVELKSFQKSKYTTSNPQGSFSAIQKAIQNGQKVLFCGSPCQCAGLKTYLGKDYNNLLTVDFLCGGMSSLSFYQDHLKVLEKRFDGKITSIDFRPKENGWGKYYMSVSFDNKKRYFVRDYMDSYFASFLYGNIAARYACRECDYNILHASDITIGDFWGYIYAGIKKHEEGMSLLTANTLKGNEQIQEIARQRYFVLNEMNLKYTDYAFRPSVSINLSDKRKNEMFFEKAQAVGFEKAAIEMMGKPGRGSQVKRYIRDRIRK